jgi:hypothetical protein
MHVGRLAGVILWRLVCVVLLAITSVILLLGSLGAVSWLVWELLLKGSLGKH